MWLLSSADARPAAVAATARAALDRLLGSYTGLGHAPAIERSAQGKPFAPAWPDLHFNLSHAGRHALLAFARGQPLGIDLECRDRSVSHTEIARRYFAPDEAAALAGLTPDQRADAFRLLWTNKEAVLKALGAGLSFGLDQVEFDVGGDGQVGALRRLRQDAGALADWIVQRLRPAPDLVGALAWRGPTRLLRTFTLEAGPARRSAPPGRLG